MSEYPSVRVTIKRPFRTGSGNEINIEYRTVARNVACEFYPSGLNALSALPGTKPRLRAQAILPPATDVRYRDRLITPSGHIFAVEDLVQTDLLCRCALSGVE